MTRYTACVICGSETGDVAVSLVEWREPIEGRRFESVPRCRDQKACRERVALVGDLWPVVEGRLAEARR